MNWKPLDYDDLPVGPVLVTNNLHAKLRDGRMSHVWCVALVQRASGREAARELPCST